MMVMVVMSGGNSGDKGKSLYGENVLKLFVKIIIIKLNMIDII